MVLNPWNRLPYLFGRAVRLHSDPDPSKVTWIRNKKDAWHFRHNISYDANKYRKASNCWLTVMWVCGRGPRKFLICINRWGTLAVFIHSIPQHFGNGLGAKIWRVGSPVRWWMVSYDINWHLKLRPLLFKINRLKLLHSLMGMDKGLHWISRIIGHPAKYPETANQKSNQAAISECNLNIHLSIYILFFSALITNA